MAKQVISVDDILKAAQAGNKTLNVSLKDSIVTPGAWDKIEELGIRFADGPSTVLASTSTVGTEDAKKTIGEQKLHHSDASPSNVQRITDQVCSLLQDQLPQAGTVDLEGLVKGIVESKLSSVSAVDVLEQNAVLTVHGGVSLINGKKVLEESIGPDIPGKVSISDAIQFQADTPHTTTYMQWKKASLNRTLEAPEFNLVVEGELDITVDGKTLKAQAGDILYMNKGASVIYSTPSSVTLACVNV